MHTRARIKAVLVTLIAVTMLATAVGSAHANRMRISTTTMRIVWSEMRFSTIAGQRVVCAVTFEGGIETQTFAKTANLRFGTITRAISGCSSTIRFLVGTAWTVHYESFTGTLPDIATMSVRVNGLAFEWIGGVYDCLYRSEAGQTQVFTLYRRAETSQISRVQPTGLTMTPIAETSDGLCNVFQNDEASITGQGLMTIVGEGAGVFLTLV